MMQNQKIFLVAVAVIALLLILFGFPRVSSKAIDVTTYQAVFLTNGQVYFGKLEKPTSRYPRLTDVYYLRQNQQIQQVEEQSASSQPQVSLIKLGDELHGPTDEMLLSRDHILFWENLKDNSMVVKAIKQQKTQAANPQTNSQAVQRQP